VTEIITVGGDLADRSITSADGGRPPTVLIDSGIVSN